VAARSNTVGLVGSRVRIPLKAYRFVSCVFCVFVGSGLANELIARSEESYRVCRIVRDLETPKTRRPVPDLCCRATENKNTECHVVPF